MNSFDWTLGQISQVRELSVKYFVAHETAQHPEVVEQMNVRARSMFKRDCRVYGVEVYHLTTTSRDSDLLNGYEFEVRWEPDTELVEFADGPLQGQMRGVLGAPHNAIQVAMLNPLVQDWTTEQTLPDDTIPVSTVTYSLSGWREIQQHWIYSCGV